ncbi:MAG: YqaE/Pmp3 family membrane protein [Candidatus Thiodiazotropha taylori]|uniref:YqaE/Pmp3 family membrane protein n=1 Tax=Candidatus Thiodiazotropha taylori TaxID=2792791 RepID=A0A9E4K9Z5_9GAMM|nr:YqaE/Pmp3 family membrane protein [Candidatus Thiodiazotropha taylori]MCW4254937.1 YqaE/Pmp3 family membrane protein [Candidatus Thiodiazotropha taylori]
MGTLLAIFVPPLSVLLNARNTFLAFVASLLFCMLGFIPGIIHAFVVRSARIDRETQEAATSELKKQTAIMEGDEKELKKIKDKEQEDKIVKVLTPFVFLAGLGYLIYSLSQSVPM